jgi:hypothetical protein
MPIDLKTRRIRVNARNNSGTVVSHLIQNFIERNHGGMGGAKPSSENICMFCGTSQNLSKEHVIPRWAFENNEKKFFITDVNKSQQTYIKTTIPACKTCNSELLSSLENNVRQSLSTDIVNSWFAIEEVENIIRWLEIMDYKFHVLDLRRKFNSIRGVHEDDQPIFLRDFPIALVRQNAVTEMKPMSELRKSLRRISTKNKDSQINSLVVYSTKNPSFNFMHTMNKFIFIEMPLFGKAFLYFYDRTFADRFEAKAAAEELLIRIYQK